MRIPRKFIGLRKSDFLGALGGMSIVDRDADIRKRFKAGQSAEQIARETNLSVSFLKRILAGVRLREKKVRVRGSGKTGRTAFTRKELFLFLEYFRSRKFSDKELMDKFEISSNKFFELTGRRPKT